MERAQAENQRKIEVLNHDLSKSRLKLSGTLSEIASPPTVAEACWDFQSISQNQRHQRWWLRLNWPWQNLPDGTTITVKSMVLVVAVCNFGGDGAVCGSPDGISGSTLPEIFTSGKVTSIQSRAHWVAGHESDTPVLMVFKSNNIENWPSSVSPPDRGFIDANPQQTAFLMVAKI